MDSLLENIDCNKTVALPKILPGSNRFIFNATLDISFTVNSNWDNLVHLRKIISATIAGQIGHKYKEWKKCSCVIAHYIFTKLNKICSSEYEGTFSIQGQYVDKDLVIGYSEIIYDWFTYDGFMTIPSTDSAGLEKERISAIFLQYTIRFLFSPALAVAQHVYSARGYVKFHEPASSEFSTTYQRIMNTEIDHEKEYNHLEMWRANYNAFSKTV